MRIIVTGAAGFVGANIVRALNRRGIVDIIAVDDLTDGMKFRNLRGAVISDYLDRRDFYDRFATADFGTIEAVFHEGACSDTMEPDGRYMLDVNYRCSRLLFDSCQAQNVRLLYASSAATYGNSPIFIEDPVNEQPLNVYGYSKLLFDNIVRQRLSSISAQVAGFRYFNVYGPHEQHKARMASVAFHHFNQFVETGQVKLFGAYGGFGPGLQERDFVWIDDLVAVKLWFFDHPEASGVYNLGTGNAEPFNTVASSVINSVRRNNNLTPIKLDTQIADGLIEYIPFPDALVGKYQCHTQANLQNLRATGCDHQFTDVATGTGRYVDWLLAAQ